MIKNGELEYGDDSFQKSRIGRATFTSWSSTEASLRIVELTAKNATTAHVHLLNAYSLAVADTDPEHTASLGRGAINLADGTPIVWASRILPGREKLRQVRGPLLFLETLSEAERAGVSVYLLGSTTDVLQRLEKRFRDEFPNLRIAGIESPPYRKLNARELMDQDHRIINSGADLVWIGLGTPKQDKEAARIHGVTGLTTVAVGAAFDFAAGTVREAPKCLHGTGLEWVFRFFQEPSRLWRRYTFGSARFFWTVIMNAKEK